MTVLEWPQATDLYQVAHCGWCDERLNVVVGIGHEVICADCAVHKLGWTASKEPVLVSASELEGGGAS